MQTPSLKGPFEAVVSIPCFELWLLLHFEDVLAAVERTDAVTQRGAHLPGYAKGQGWQWTATRHHLDAATGRAKALTA